MRVRLSFTSLAEARKNLDAEAGGKSFDALRAAAERSWRTQLAKVRVRGGGATARKLLYTAIYHALIEPSTFSDTDGSYRGMDGRVHRGGGVTQYANISGWDVYRAQTPLMAMLEPRRAEELASSLIRDGQQSGCLPRWPYADQQTDVMVGDPSEPMIAAIHAFGARGFDALRSLEHDRIRRGQRGAVHVGRSSRPRPYLGNEPTLATPWLYDWLGEPTAASDCYAAP